MGIHIWVAKIGNCARVLVLPNHFPGGELLAARSTSPDIRRPTIAPYKRNRKLPYREISR